MTLCSTNGCDRPAKKRGMCPRHYERWRRHRVDVERCAYPGCENSRSTRGWCDMHYHRWLKYGSVDTVLPSCGGGNHSVHLRGSAHPYWTGDNASYDAAHGRLRRINGPASQHKCRDCGEQAQQWSYNGLDPNERVGPHRNHKGDLSMCRYSPAEDPTPFYEPRCRKCHRIFDHRLITGRR